MLALNGPEPWRNPLRAAQTPAPAEETLHALFEAQAARTPGAPALSFEGATLSYAELDLRAGRLARRLRALGVGAEARVGVFVERSAEAVVGILGTLKAGGAYVPIDPGTPPQRVALLLADAGAEVLLTQTKLAGCVAAPRPVLLDRFDWDAEGESIPRPVPAPGDLAYVIYTSGSTGRPKGVCVEHRQIASYVRAVVERLRLEPGMSYALVSTLAADLGHTVLFSALATGGLLHVVSQERAESPALLSEYFEREGIDVLKITPSHLAALQAGSRPERVMPRRRLVLGGEASRLAWVERLRALAPDCAIFNHYGPTEATVGALTYEAGATLPKTPSGALPLGRPLANAAAYVLDSRGEPAAEGEVGQLCIGGRGVARGYLGLPQKTAERFVPDPFSAWPGARLYRTGDLARRLPGGDLEFCGRADDQVKINGYRVEPGEVEEALRAHPGVREALVLSREEEDGARRLVAHVVPVRSEQPLFSAPSVHVLPDGAPVAHLNRNETDYIHDEIFVRRAYLKHGVTLKDGDCVVDAGANIGMFTVFSSRVAADLRIVALEPNRAAFECLKANAAAYGARVTCLPYGLSSENGTAALTVFEGLSLLSGFHADAAREGEVVTRYALAHAAGSAGDAPPPAELRTVVGAHLRAHTEAARLRTLSSVLREEGIGRVDLLKVNVEKSEVEVLRGIAEEDWPKIRQLVIEVDLDENVAPVTEILERHGYEVLVEQDPLLHGTELRYVYAIRPSEEGRLVRERTAQAEATAPLSAGADLLTPRGLRRFLKERLPHYMVPSGFLLHERLPLTPNGKVDRQALAALPDATQPAARDFVRPRTEAETALAGIWSELLKVERVGVNDDFFELGGHSLLAIRAVSRIRDLFGREMPAHALFESPTIAALAPLLAEAEAPGSRPEPIRPRTHGGPVPLSFPQEALWLFDRLAPGLAVYNVVDVVPLPGAWDVDAMRRALRELVRRHEALRTRFAERDGRPVQIVLPTVHAPLADVDLSALPEPERGREWDRAVREEARRPFVLSEPPLLRGTAIHLSPLDHRLLLVVHHAVADEWSMEIIQQELAELYAAFSSGRPYRLPPLPVQYPDFACWQRERLRGPLLDGQRSWWEKELAGAPTVLELPTDRPRPAVQSFRGATASFRLSDELLARARALAREEQATLFMLLHAAFLALLHRWSGQEDLLVGTPITGRSRSETERMVGCFINTVVIRGRFAGEPSGRALLRQVRERAMGAYAHPDLPFEEVVAALAPERDPGRTPLFQAMFVLHDAEGVSRVSKASGNRDLHNGTSKVDLTLTLAEEGNGLEGLVEYATDLFDAATIRRLCGHYETLLSAMLAEPERSVATLPMLTADERTALAAWNDTAAPVPDGRVDEQISARAARVPGRVAVSGGGEELTYGELEARAASLARRLRAHGVGPGVRVGVCMERTPGMLVALLATWKAGGAYVPLDPGFPAERLAYMLEDSGARVLLTHAPAAAALPACAAVVVHVDRPQEAAPDSGADPAPAVADDLAYVLYTSGSTGRPKGVAVTHRSLSNLLESMRREPGIAEEDVLLSVTTLSFDIAALELYLPLLAGARVVLAGREEAQDGASLAALLSSSNATVLQATPTTWRLLIEAGWEGTPGLKVLCGGEALPRDLADELRRRAFEVWNLYGPTETTVWSSAWRVEAGPVSIGRPIANTQMWVVDARLQPLPVGVPGELCICGAGVAWGYWGKPELTAERFVPDPFSPVPGARLYRTGDVARRLPDGRLECLGRRDAQVKVRGFRIEPGEIEATLRDLPAVVDAAVVPEDDPSAGRRLVAYVVCAPGAEAGGRELRAHLAAKLAPYMIPAAFVPVDALPRTPNGKLDRAALARAAARRAPEAAEAGEASEAPPTPTERRVAEIWGEVLGTPAPGRHDNFFDLGGHSLAAVRIASRLRATFGVEPGLARLFRAPSVAELSAEIDGLLAEGSSLKRSSG